MLAGRSAHSVSLVSRILHRRRRSRPDWGAGGSVPSSARPTRTAAFMCTTTCRNDEGHQTCLAGGPPRRHYRPRRRKERSKGAPTDWAKQSFGQARPWPTASQAKIGDRKSTRLNSSHSQISYAVFCLKKKKKPKLYA